MDNVKRKSNKLKLAFAVAFVLFINIVIGIMAATSVVLAASNGNADKRGWGTSDLKVGDYITIGDKDWQVIENDSHGTVTAGDAGETQSGVLLRLVDSLGEYFFDGDRSSSYRGNTIDINGNPASSTRVARGTNYLDEASIKAQLKTAVIDGLHFTDAEKASIATIPQQQIVWWGEAKEFHPTENGISIKDWTVAPTSGPISNVQGTKTYDLGLRAPTDAGQSQGYTTDSATVDKAAEAAQEDVFRYEIMDQIFLPDVTQIQKIKKAEAQGVTRVDTLTRTPFAYNPASGSQILAYKGDKIVTLDTMGNDSNKLSVTPMLYLDLNTVFEQQVAATGGKMKYTGLSNVKDQFGYTDVVVGDYITMGEIKWRIISKDATNGFLVRADRMLKNDVQIAPGEYGDAYQFDAPRPAPRLIGEYQERAAVNADLAGAYVDTGFAGGISSNHSNSRTVSGSNFYWESDIRSYLTGDFLNKFTEYERSVMNEVENKLQYWWGDEVASNTNGTDTYTAATNGKALNSWDQTGNKIISRHFSRFDANSGLYVSAKDDQGGDMTAILANKTAPTKNAGGTKYIADRLPSKTFVGNNALTSAQIDALLAPLPTYSVRDKVFVPSLKDVAIANEAKYVYVDGGKTVEAPLKNFQGNSYARATHVAGSPSAGHGTYESYFLSTPNVFNETAKTDYNDLNNGSSILTMVRNGSFHKDDASEVDDGLLPQMYIKADTLFDVNGVVANNTGETTILRPTNVTGDATANSRKGWRDFSPATSGETLDTISDADFAKAKVDVDNIRIQLSQVGTFEVTQQPAGSDVDGGEMVISSGNVLSWTPKKAGATSFKIKNNEGKEVEFNTIVAKGDVVVGTPKPLNGAFAAALSTVSLTDVATTSKPGMFTYVNDATTTFPVEGTLDAQNRPITQVSEPVLFTPTDVANYNTVTINVTINLTSEDLLNKVKDLIGNATFTANYGQTLGDVLPEVQKLVANQSPEITVEWDLDKATSVGEVNAEGNTFTAIFSTENGQAPLDLKIKVSSVEATAPELPSGLGLKYVFGTKLSEPAKVIEEALNGAGTVTAADATVGDVGTNKFDFKFKSVDTNLSETTIKNVEIEVTPKVREDAEKTVLVSRIDGKLKGKLYNGMKYEEVKKLLPAGFSLVTTDALVAGKVGDVIDVKLNVSGKVDQSKDGEYAKDNYQATEITVKVTLVAAPEADKGGNVVLIIVLVVVGVAAIGGAAFFILKKKSAAGSKF